MNQINVQYYKTKYGELILGSFDKKLCLLDFRYRKMRKTVDNRIKKGLDAEYIEQDDEILQKTRVQLTTVPTFYRTNSTGYPYRNSPVCIRNL